MSEPSTFGSRLKAARLEAGLSQDELARRAGSSKGYISELETTQTGRPSADLALKLAEAVGVTVEHLVRGDAKQQDMAFFRSYQALDEPTKSKLNGIMKVLKGGVD